MQRKLLPTINRITMESVAYEGLKLEKNLGRWDGYPIDCMHVHAHTCGPSVPIEQREFCLICLAPSFPVKKVSLFVRIWASLFYSMVNFSPTGTPLKSPSFAKKVSQEKALCCLAVLVQFRSVAQLCPTLCSPIDCSMPGFPVLHHLPEFAQTRIRWVSDTIQLSCTLSSPSPLAFNLSQHQGLCCWVSSSHQVAKVLELQLQHQSFQRIFRLDFFRADWFDLVVQGTLKSLLQHHSPKATILRCSAFFLVQLSHPYTTTGKTIALTRWTFVCKVMSLPESQSG